MTNRKTTKTAALEYRKNVMNERRAILLVANQRIRFENEKKYKLFLIPFTAMREGFLDYIKIPLLQKTISEDYMVKIWVDENHLFHAEDISQTDDWYEEAFQRKMKRLTDAFGYADESDVANY